MITFSKKITIVKELLGVTQVEEKLDKPLDLPTVKYLPKRKKCSCR